MTPASKIRRWDALNGYTRGLRKAQASFAASDGSAAASNYCYRPAAIRPGMSGRDLLKIAHGGEEIGPHEYVSGKCKHCGQQEPPNDKLRHGGD